MNARCQKKRKKKKEKKKSQKSSPLSLFMVNAERVKHPHWKIAIAETSWKSDLYFY